MRIYRKIGVKYKLASLLFSLLLAVAFIGPAYTWAGESSFKISTVEFTGLTGTENNLQFAFDHYALLTPYAPSEVVTDDTTLDNLDNHFLYVVDSKRIKEPQRANLGNCYYPTRAYFEPNSQTIFVRGTELVEVAPNEYEPYAIITHLHMNLTDDNKPAFDTTAPQIRIKGINEDFAADAPDDFVLDYGGKILVFTNGASIFTYSVGEGYVYQKEFVLAKDYSSDNRISYLGIDSQNHILSVVTTEKTKGDDGKCQYGSEVYIYH